MLKIGIVGCGTIGSNLARAVEEKFAHNAEVAALCDAMEEKSALLAAALKNKPNVLPAEELVEECDLIIEASSKEYLPVLFQLVISRGKDILVMSAGGLIGNEDMIRQAEEKGCRVYIPSGALCGIDGVKGANLGKIRKATLTTRKPPKSLTGAPYLIKNKINVDEIKKETLLFEGTVVEAVDAFPQNINVAATLSLAGIGPVKTRVRIITSPEYTTNSHEIEVEGDFGKLWTKTDNFPSPQNPKTSYLAVLSAIATLKGMMGSIKVGT
ncbi:MAG: aspartate dehydrogenase [Candidatus Omnitrophica bacterium]|nr:aspartate dehydrogenase [Candidatus Omnitrophota bacterium]